MKYPLPERLETVRNEVASTVIRQIRQGDSMAENKRDWSWVSFLTMTGIIVTIMVFLIGGLSERMLSVEKELRALGKKVERLDVKLEERTRGSAGG